MTQINFVINVQENIQNTFDIQQPIKLIRLYYDAMKSWSWACGSYRVFIKYCVFSEDFKIFRTLVFLCFPSVSLCTHTRQVEHQRFNRTGRV